MHPHAHHFIIVALVSAIVISGAWLFWPEDDTGWPDPLPRTSPLPVDETVVEFGGELVCDAWIANNSTTRSQGLIGTEREETRGMLFIFNNLQYRTFHMNGMAYAIDIIYMDENQEVVEVWPDYTPADPPHASEEPVMYVLEVVSGRAAALNIEVGSTLEWGEL